MAQIVVQDDGAYLVAPDGREMPLDGAIVLINANGGITLRFPPSDVTVRAQPVHARMYDFRGQVLRLALAVARGGLTIAEISAVAPGMAAVVNNLLTTNGWTPGSVE